ncbi:hypothetical protein PEPS_41260 (plasmid) [Persicobacter psychrovividus]|uniref:Uncharacterized protein n=1 Tax=Persicobacter psychrovividus TaxID=387638 RepID=A0ABN6LF86_9BACT|nr:hypothetical protein PEPS_41260 [Persicobacter psychrovividus]
MYPKAKFALTLSDDFLGYKKLSLSLSLQQLSFFQQAYHA